MIAISLPISYGGRIGRETGRTTRQAFHMLSTGALPAKKVGGVDASRTEPREVLVGVDAARECLGRERRNPRPMRYARLGKMFILAG